MKAKAVPSSWIYRSGLRLDSKPFLSGALEARVIIEGGRFPREPLSAVTTGHNGGIFNGPQFSRRYVSADYGVPFVGSSSMLMADLSHLPYLRKKDALSPKLSHLRLEPGTTLISCSGTIGRMVYVRPDMDGIWSSQHIMKVVPDTAKIPPGYLYAFLSSKYGIPMVTSGTYGAIIQHIEPEHIAGLPVPRLGGEVEKQAHALVEKAATLRTDAACRLKSAGGRFDALVGRVDLQERSPRVSLVAASRIVKRMDAEFHDPVVAEIQQRLSEGDHETIGSWCSEVSLPGIFKRLHTDDPRYGAPYFTGASLFWLEPLPKALLSFRTSLFEQVQLEEGTVLVQAFGQEGGLTGRSVWVGKHLAGCTTTHMLARLRCVDVADSAYLFGFLQSDAAYFQIKCQTYGGSIPHFDERGISSVVMPILEEGARKETADIVLASVRDRDQALSLEREARAMVEQAIEEAA